MLTPLSPLKILSRPDLSSHFFMVSKNILARCSAFIAPQVPRSISGVQNKLQTSSVFWSAAVTSHSSIKVHIVIPHFLKIVLNNEKTEVSSATIGLASPSSLKKRASFSLQIKSSFTMALHQNSRLLSLFYISHTERKHRHFYGQTKNKISFFQ